MGTPIATAGMGMESRDALIAQTRERVQDLLRTSARGEPLRELARRGGSGRTALVEWRAP